MAFGDARDLCPCDRAAAAARRPLCHEATLAVANGRAVPDGVAAAFERLPDVMNRAEAKAGQVDSAVLELAEAVVLSGRVGERFVGAVTDVDKKRGARIQLAIRR